MPPYGEPDWATPGNTTNPSITQVVPGVTNPQPVTSGSNANTAEAVQNARLIIVILSILNIGLSAMMATLGMSAVIHMHIKSLSNLTQAFLAIYMVIFAVLLFLYEFIWWQPMASVNKVFRKNFGFMYGFNGKGFYLIFIAFLCLGLWDSDHTSPIKHLDIITFIAFLFGGALHICISIFNPDIKDVYRAPTVGLDGGDNVV